MDAGRVLDQKTDGAAFQSLLCAHVERLVELDAEKAREVRGGLLPLGNLVGLRGSGRRRLGRGGLALLGNGRLAGPVAAQRRDGDLSRRPGSVDEYRATRRRDVGPRLGRARNLELAHLGFDLLSKDGVSFF